MRPVNSVEPYMMASYKEQIIPKYQGNPFIEALPDRVDMSTFIDMLASSPPLDTKFTQLPAEDRLELIQQIKADFWLPMPSHYDKFINLYSMIKMGYRSRNPMHAMYNRQFAIGIEKILKAGLDNKGANLAGNIHCAQSVIEIAINGYGKSVLYQRMLTTFFPKVIYHNEYKGRHLTCAQLVWVFVECPYNKSVSTFCKMFYLEVDKAMGTDFYNRFGESKGTIDQHVFRVAKVATQVNLGLLVIDEIQKIQTAATGGKDNMIDFITQLVNTLGVPIIMLGSFKALYLLKDSLANTRRGLPNGYAENLAGYLSEDSWEWGELVENLWSLQYTKTYTASTTQLKKAMYTYSMGIPDIAVHLFMHVQSLAIKRGGNEKITVSLFKTVADTSLRLVMPILQRIKSGDPSAYSELDDIKPDWVALNGYIKAADHQLEVYGSLAIEHSRALQQKDKVKILRDLSEFALRLVNSPELAASLAETVYNASNGLGELTGMYNQLAQMIADIKGDDLGKQEVTSEGKPSGKRSTAKTRPDMSEDDIRYVVKSGYKRGMTTEEALEEKGYIRETDELLTLISS